MTGRRFWRGIVSPVSSVTASRDPFGQALAAATDEMSAPDDRTIRFRLKRPFGLLPDVLASTPLFMPAIMPERLANTDPMHAGAGDHRQRAVPFPEG